MSRAKRRAIEKVRTDLARTRTEDFGERALCEALEAVIDLIGGIRDSLTTDVAKWAKEALPWYLRWLVSEKVAGAVLDGLLSALKSWRAGSCG